MNRNVPRICRECRHLVVLDAWAGAQDRRKSSTVVSKDRRRGWFSTRQRDNYTLGTLYPPWWLPSVPGFLELTYNRQCPVINCHSGMAGPALPELSIPRNRRLKCPTAQQVRRSMFPIHVAELVPRTSEWNGNDDFGSNALSLGVILHLNRSNTPYVLLPRFFFFFHGETSHLAQIISR